MMLKTQVNDLFNHGTDIGFGNICCFQRAATDFLLNAENAPG